jgi:hypothetical protein
MGQAKLRGGFAQRQAEGIARLALEATERQRIASEAKAREQQRRADLYASDPEQYEREKQDRMRLPMLIAMLGGMMAADPLRNLRRSTLP